MARSRFEELKPESLAELSGGMRVIDVREPEEFAGPLGHLPRAELVPLNALAHAASGWDRAQPLLLVCRSGSRSRRAAELLLGLGFRQVYNLDGGMLAVEALGANAPRVVG